MVSNLDVDFGKLGDSPPLITCSVSIIDRNWCRSCMHGNVVLCDKGSVNGTAGAATVDQDRDHDSGKVF